MGNIVPSNIGYSSNVLNNGRTRKYAAVSAENLIECTVYRSCRSGHREACWPVAYLAK